MLRKLFKKFKEKQTETIHLMVENDIKVLNDICEQGFKLTKYWDGEYKLNNLNEDFLRKHKVSEDKITEYFQAYSKTKDKVDKDLIKK